MKKKINEKNIDELPIMLTVKDVADMLNIGRDAAYRLVEREDFPKINLGKKAMRFPKNEVLKYVGFIKE